MNIPNKSRQTMAVGMLSILLTVAPLFAQMGLPADQRINGKLVWQAFEPQREVLQTSSAVIYTDAKSWVKTLYGVVVSEDGYILTKASEIEGAESLTLRIGGELYSDVEIVSVDPEWDVAMLKVEPSEKLVPVRLSEQEDVQQGHWVVSNGSSTRYRRRVKVGIVSAITREIKPDSSKVVLGVELGTVEGEELKVKTLSKGAGAEKAGLKEGDVLLLAGDMKLKERADLLKALTDKEPGDTISIQVMRNGQKLSFDVELTARKAGPGMMSRNDQMSGGALQLSSRRSGFPRVIHHDTPLTKVSVGGPLLDLDGVCVGMNIARADRVATFAIPARELREIIDRMRE